MIYSIGVEGTDCLTRRRGTIYERLRISLIAPMVITYRDDTLDRDGGD